MKNDDEDGVGDGRDGTGNGGGDQCLGRDQGAAANCIGPRGGDGIIPPRPPRIGNVHVNTALAAAHLPNLSAAVVLVPELAVASALVAAPPSPPSPLPPLPTHQPQWTRPTL